MSGPARLGELADGVRRHVGLEAEERVDGLAADVEGGDPGRGEDGDALERLPAPELEERRFSGPGLAGDEDVAVRSLQDIEGAAEAGVDLDRSRRDARHRKLSLFASFRRVNSRGAIGGEFDTPYLE